MQASLSLDDINAELAAAAEAQRPQYVAPVALHPFQRVGLGRAPFKCVDCTVDDGEDTRCQFCTTPIKYVYHIVGADGSRFHVGSKCVKQTGGEVEGFELFNRQMTARVRKLQGDARKAREASKAATAAAEWKAAHAPEMAYMQQRAAKGNGFYSYLLSAVEKYGSIYDSRLESVRADMARDAARPAAQAAAVAAAPVVSLDAVEAAFARAKEAGIAWPKLRLGGFVFSPAGANSLNAGAIYIKTRMPAGDMPGQYLGKVLGGKFLKVRECDADQAAEILDICKDPKAAAVAYGKRFGRCSVCNRELTDAASVEAGIGPVCATKYGF